MNLKNLRKTIKYIGGKEFIILFAVSVAIAGVFLMGKEIKTINEGVKAEPAFIEGTLVKSSDYPAVYRITDGKRKHIPSPQIFESRGYSWDNIRVVSRQEIESVPEIKLLKTSEDTNMYYIDNLQKRVLKTDDVINSYGLSKTDAFLVEKQEIDTYPTAYLLKRADDEKVYYITRSGMRRHIPTAQVFESYGNKWYNIVTVTYEDLVSYSINSAIKLEGTSKVYWLVTGKTTTKKHWISTADAFNRLGLKWAQVVPVNSVEFNAYPEGDSVGYDDIIVDAIAVPIPSQDQQKIQDALSRGVAINPQSDILLRDLQDYQIIYINSTKTFLISVLNANFSGTRQRAENDLASLLGVSHSTICSLSVEITTPAYINSSLAGQVFSLSSCP